MAQLRREGWQRQADGRWTMSDHTQRRWRCLLTLVDRGPVPNRVGEFVFAEDDEAPLAAGELTAETWLIEFTSWAEDGFPEDVRACALAGDSWVFLEVLLGLTMDDEASGSLTFPPRLQRMIEARIADGSHDAVPILEFTWWGYIDALASYLFEGPRVLLDDDDWPEDWRERPNPWPLRP